MISLTACIFLLIFVYDSVLFSRKIKSIRNLSNQRIYLVTRNLLLLATIVVIYLVTWLKNLVFFIASSSVCTCFYIHISLNTYRVLAIARFINEVLCKQKGCKIYLGFFFAVTWFRDFLVFCFFKGGVHMIVGDVSACVRSRWIYSFLNVYFHGKILERFKANGAEVITIRGKAYVYNPREKSWCKIEEQVLVIKFLDVEKAPTMTSDSQDFIGCRAIFDMGTNEINGHDDKPLASGQ
ncbi:MAG: hypothetical protein QXH98_02520 [Candidatus Korarchaeota archaeon]